MGTQFIDGTAPSLQQGALQKPPAELPHGLLTPPPRVLEIVAAQQAKCAPGFFKPEAIEQATNQLTLQYYFDQLGHDILYRSTPAGPEVLAVGYDEILAMTKHMSPEERGKLKTWMF